MSNNIIIRPTTKHSFLYLNNQKLCFNKEFFDIPTLRENQFLYIISYEELVLGGYHFNSKYGNEPQKTNQRDIDSREYWEDEDYYIARILFTNDTDLIADGISSINDEFLDWFVKNPNCRKVNVFCFNNIYVISTPAENSKQEERIKTQKLSRQGLKEIYSVACDDWREKLEDYGKRNILEDYIELTQDEVDEMFNSRVNSIQYHFLSTYLKEDDSSVDVRSFKTDKYGFFEPNFYIIRDREQGEYKSKSFLLSERFNWEIKKDSLGQLCLIPTRIK
jgi:hypothetical protein